MNQRHQILEDLKAGNRITALDALHNYRCFRLAARVQELRKAGHRIKTGEVITNGKRIAEYWMEVSK